MTFRAERRMAEDGRPNSLGVTLREFIEHEIDALKELLQLELTKRDMALSLQAKEYERRLHDLNGEYVRDRERQQDFVTVDKYEDKMKAEATARSIALERVDEKFNEYVKRYEQRQREVDLRLQAQQQAADEAERNAERTAQLAKDASAEAFRKSNRNIAFGGLGLTVIIVAMNLIGAI